MKSKRVMLMCATDRVVHPNVNTQSQVVTDLVAN